MKATEVIREIMRTTNVGVGQLSRRLDMKRTTLSMIFGNGNATAKNVVRFCKALDYKVVIMPMSSRLPEGAIEVDE